MADELSPLYPSESLETEHVGEVKFKGSVYDYVLLMPPLSRALHGSYLTSPVVVGYALFFLTVTLQASLTLIAGSHILQGTIDWKDNLIQDHRLHSWDRFFQSAKKKEDVFLKGLEALTGLENNTLWRSLDETPAEASNCCIGVVCALEGAMCCPSRSYEEEMKKRRRESKENILDEVVHKAEDMWTPQFLRRKPGAAKGQKGEDTGKIHRSAAVCQILGGDRDRDDVHHSMEGEISCLPPTLAIISLWDQLDVDGNGVWSLNEALWDEYNLGCKLGVAVEDFHRSATRGIIMDHDSLGDRAIGDLPGEIESRRGIPKQFFNWYSGLATMCINTDPSLCGSLVRRGLFDSLLKDSPFWTPFDLDGVMRYCQRLLTPGGVCDAALPGAYTMYRTRVAMACGAPALSVGPRYMNPYSSQDATGTMEVSFANLQSLEMTHTHFFLFFMFNILVLWYVNLVDEVQDVIHLWDFVHNYPVDATLAEDFGIPGMRRSSSLHARFQTVLQNTGMARSSFRDQNADASDVENTGSASTTFGRRFTKRTRDDVELSPESIVIDSVSPLQKLISLAIAIMRSILVTYLGWAGSVFLLSNRTYLDLLLNAVALAFVFELDDFIFNFLAPIGVQEQLEALRPLTFRSSIPSGMAGIIFQKYIWGLFLIPLWAAIVVLDHDVFVTSPVVTALQCACLKTGDRCIAEQILSKSALDAYWSANGTAAH